MDITVFRPTTKQQLGPFGPETVRDMLAKGELSNDDLIYYAGLKEWTPISALPATAVSPPAAAVSVAPAVAPAISLAAPAPLTLEARVAELERRLKRSNLYDQKFWSRAFAVFGHNFAAVLAIYAVLFVVGLIFFLIVAVAGGLSR